MQYILLLNENQNEFDQRNDPDRSAAYWGGWNAFITAMYQAGIVVKGDGLEGPNVATTVRIRDGKRSVQDGPYADTKEQLGGYFVIDVQDLDAALEWAAKAPCVHAGSVEVRPVLRMAAPPA
jgi:hypothetical protein